MLNKIATLSQYILLISTFLLCTSVSSSSLCERLIKESTDDSSLQLELGKNMHDLKQESTE